jgi:hypothetical protein
VIAAIYAMGMRARRWPKSIAVYTDEDDFIGTLRDGAPASWVDEPARKRLEGVAARARLVNV